MHPRITLTSIKHCVRKCVLVSFSFWVVLVLSLGWQGIQGLFAPLIPGAAAATYSYTEDFSTDTNKDASTTGTWGGGVATLGHGEAYNWTKLHEPEAAGKLFYPPTYNASTCTNTSTASCMFAMLRIKQVPLWTPDNGARFYELLPGSLQVSGSSALDQPYATDIAFSADFENDFTFFVAYSSALGSLTTELYKGVVNIGAGTIEWTSYAEAGTGIEGVAVSPDSSFGDCSIPSLGQCTVYIARAGDGVVRNTNPGIEAWEVLGGPSDGSYTNPSNLPDTRPLNHILLTVDDPDPAHPGNHILYYVSVSGVNSGTPSVYKLTNAIEDPDGEDPDPLQYCGAGGGCAWQTLPALDAAQRNGQGSPVANIDGSIDVSPNYATNRTLYFATSTSAGNGGLAKFIDDGVGTSWENLFSLNDIAPRIPLSLGSVGVYDANGVDALTVAYIIVRELLPPDDQEDTQWPYGDDYARQLIINSSDAGVTWSQPALMAGAGITNAETDSAAGLSMAYRPGTTATLTLYAPGIGRMYITEDGGTTWGTLSNYRGPSVLTDMAFSADYPQDPTMFVSYVGSQNIYRSRDGGATFERLLPDSNLFFDIYDCDSGEGGIQPGIWGAYGVWGNIAISPHYSVDRTVFVSTYGGLAYGENTTCTGAKTLRSTDGGDTWEILPNPPEVADDAQLGVPAAFIGLLHPVVPPEYDGTATGADCTNTLKCSVFAIGSAIAILRSDDHGQTWQMLADAPELISAGTPLMSGSLVEHMTLSPQFRANDGVIVGRVSGNQGYLISNDGGQTFSFLTVTDLGLPGDSIVGAFGFENEFDNADTGAGGCAQGGHCAVGVTGFDPNNSYRAIFLELTNGFKDAQGNTGAQSSMVNAVSLSTDGTENIAAATELVQDAQGNWVGAFPRYSLSSANKFRVARINETGVIPSTDVLDVGSPIGIAQSALPAQNDIISMLAMPQPEVGELFLGAGGQLWRSYEVSTQQTSIVSKDLGQSIGNIRRVSLSPAHFIPAGTTITYSLSNTVDPEDVTRCADGSFSSSFENGGDGVFSGAVGEPGQYEEPDAPLTMIFPAVGEALCFRAEFGGSLTSSVFPVVSGVTIEYSNTPPELPAGAVFNPENRTLAVDHVTDADAGDKYTLLFEIRPLSGTGITQFDQMRNATGWSTSGLYTARYDGDPSVSGDPATFTLPNTYQFTEGGQYEWRVRARDVGGAYSLYTPWVSFTATNTDPYLEEFASAGFMQGDDSVYAGLPLQVDTKHDMVKQNDTFNFDAPLSSTGLGGGDISRFIPFDANGDGRVDVLVVRDNPTNFATLNHASHTILYENTTVGGTVSFEPKVDFTHQISEVAGYTPDDTTQLDVSPFSGGGYTVVMRAGSTVVGMRVHALENNHIGLRDTVKSFAFTASCESFARDGLAIGDMDARGGLEVVSSCANSASVKIYDTARGTLVTAASAVAAHAQEILDIDQDGDKDVVLMENGSSTITLLTNDGKNRFAKTSLPLTSPVSALTRLEAVPLFRSNGVVTLAYTVSSGESGVLVFSPAESGISVEQIAMGDLSLAGAQVSNTCAIVFADLGGDGDHDVLLGSGTNFLCNGNQSVTGLEQFTSIFEGRLSGLGGTFFNRLVPINTGTSSGYNVSALAVADINGDGQLDILSSDIGASAHVMLQRDGAGMVGEPMSAHPVLTALNILETGTNATIGDAVLPGVDSSRAVAYGVSGEGAFRIAVARETGFFESSVAPQAFDPAYDGMLPGALPDLNQDGLTDYALVSLPGYSQVLALSSGEAFTYTPIANAPQATPRATDLNGDSVPDLLYTHCGENCGVRTLLSTGSGSYAAVAPLVAYIKGGNLNGNTLDTTAFLDLWSTAPFDVDGDGDKDMVAFVHKPSAASQWASYGWTSDYGYIVFKNRGNGSFDAVIGRSATGFGGEAEYDGDMEQVNELTAADIDGDGHMDVFMTAGGGENPLIAWNNGSGMFDVQKVFVGQADTVATLGTTVPRAFDINSDGFMDIAFAVQKNASDEMWIGWGGYGRSFTLSRIASGLPTRIANHAFSVGDIDGDGDGDMIIIDGGDPVNGVYGNKVFRYAAGHSDQGSRTQTLVSKAYGQTNANIQSLTLRVWKLVMPHRDGDTLTLQASTTYTDGDVNSYNWVDGEETCPANEVYCDYVFDFGASGGRVVAWKITTTTQSDPGQSVGVYRITVPAGGITLRSSGGGGSVPAQSAKLTANITSGLASYDRVSREHVIIWKVETSQSLVAQDGVRVVFQDKDGATVDARRLLVPAEDCSGGSSCVNYFEERGAGLSPDSVYARKVVLKSKANAQAEESVSKLSPSVRTMANPPLLVRESGERVRPIVATVDTRNNPDKVFYALAISGSPSTTGWVLEGGTIAPFAPDAICEHQSRTCEVPRDAQVTSDGIASRIARLKLDDAITYYITLFAINGEDVLSADAATPFYATTGPILQVNKKALPLALGSVFSPIASLVGAVYASLVPTAYAAELPAFAPATSGTLAVGAYHIAQTLRLMSGITGALIGMGLLVIVGALYAIMLMHDRQRTGLVGVAQRVWHVLVEGSQKNFETLTPKTISGTFKFAYIDYKRRHDYLRASLKAFFSLVLTQVIVFTLLFSLGVVAPEGVFASPEASISRVTQGDTVMYEITLKNTGNAPADSVIVTDVLPDKARYAGSATLSRAVGSSTPLRNEESQNSGRLQFNIGTLKQGETVFVRYKAKISDDAVGDVTNSVKVAYGNQYARTENTLIATPNDKNPIIPPQPEENKAIPSTSDRETSNATSASETGDSLSINGVTISDVQVAYVPTGVKLSITGGVPELGGSVEFVIMPQSSVFQLIPTAHAATANFPLVLTYTPEALRWEFTSEVALSRGGYQIFAYFIRQTGDRSPASAPKSFRVDYASPAEALADNFNTLASFSPRELAASPQVQQVNQAYVAPLLFAVAILNASWAVNIYNLLSLFQQFVTQPALLLERRRRKGWGVVYNALTKLPVDLAVVRLHDAKTGKLLQTRVTDKQGRYAFLVEAGEYRILVTKTGYKFPSLFARGKSMDVDFIDIYQGKDIIAPAPMTIALNIPFDPEERVEEPREVLMRVELRRLQSAFSVFGMVCALGSFIISPNIFVGGLLMGHVLLYGVFRRLAIAKQPKSWGSVIDARTKSPLAQSIVRIFDTQFNKLLDTQITDTRGRYGFLVGRNAYYVTYEHQGYEKERGPVIDLSQSRGNNEIVAEDVALKRLKS